MASAHPLQRSSIRSCARSRRDERRQAFALLWRAARPDRRQLVLASALLLAAGGLEALGPIFGKLFIDEYLLPRRLEWWPVALLVGGIVVSGCMASALRYFQLVRLAGVAMRSVRRLRESVYNHVLRLPMAFFDRAITGQLVSRITNDTEQIRQLYVQVLFEMLQGVTVLIGAVVAMAWLDWRLMLIVLTLIPATVLIVIGYQRLSAHAVMRSRELRSDINAQMGESIAGMSVLQATGAARRFAARFANTNREHYKARLGEVRANAWLLRPALDMMNILLIVAIIAAFGTQSFGALEIGLLYAFITYVARVVEPLISITMQFSLLQQALVAASRVNTLLDEGESQRVTHERRVSRGHVQLIDVSFGYDPRAAGAARRQHRCTRRQLRRNRRPHRQRQIDAAVAVAALLRAAGRAAWRSTAFRSPRSAMNTFAPMSGWCRRSRSCSPRARARTSTWDAICRWRRSRPRRARPMRTDLSAHSSRATTRRSAKVVRGCRRGRSS